jgi:hypothetical protein
MAAVPEVVIRVRLVFERGQDGAVHAVYPEHVAEATAALVTSGEAAPWNVLQVVVRADDLRLVLDEGTLPSPMPPELADAHNRLVVALLSAPPG